MAMWVRKIAILAVVLALSNTQAFAQTKETTQGGGSNWYLAETCTIMSGSTYCSLNFCDVSKVSPAQLYERNEDFGGAKIIDDGTGKVVVVEQGGTTRVVRRCPESVNVK